MAAATPLCDTLSVASPKWLVCPCLNISIDCSAAESEVPCPVGPNGSLVHPTPAVCELLSADEASHPIFATSAETPTADPQDKPRGWQPVYAPASLTTQGSHSSSTGSLVQQSAQSGSSQVLASGRAAFESLSVDAPSLAQPSVSGDLLATVSGLLVQQQQTREIDNLPYTLPRVHEKLPMLVQRVRVGRWIMSRCVLCSSHVYAQRFYGPQTDYILVNRDILLSDGAIDVLLRHASFSSAFGVILPQVDKLPTVKQNSAGNDSVTGSTSSVLSGSFIHPDSRRVAQIASEYLASEQAEMEDRIRAFVEAQHVAFEAVKARARAEKQILLSALETATPLLDDGNDSAVPLSPFSVNSADPSPVTHAQIERSASADVTPTRPKAFSNPPSLQNRRARRRYAGGSGDTERTRVEPTLDEEDDLFAFDDPAMFGQLPSQPHDFSDDDIDTDDSGAVVEDAQVVPVMRQKRNRHPAAPNGKAPPMAAQRGRPLIPESNMAYGTSLPVTIPGFGAAPRLRQPSWSSGSEYAFEEEESEARMTDRTLGADEDHSMEESTMITDELISEGMMALAQQQRPWDDPERLFGDRPNRRRYPTGDLVRQQPVIAQQAEETK